jgi:Ser/Thr protein kinase RdoA (MazF antagonist)
MKHIKLLGQVLGWLHHDLANFPVKSLDNKVSNLESKLATMNKYFVQKNVADSLEQKLKLGINKNIFVQFEQLLFQLSKLTKQQVLHLDFVRGNILFDDSPVNSLPSKFIFTNQLKKNNPASQLRISGVLDFEKTAYGPKVIDLARTLAFLIIDCKYKEADKVKKYFLNSGYQKRGQQKLTNRELLEPLIAYFLFYDFYKFLKHNPYEFLPQNEHFVRTRQWLLKRKMITTRE